MQALAGNVGSEIVVVLVVLLLFFVVFFIAEVVDLCPPFALVVARVLFSVLLDVDRGGAVLSSLAVEPTLTDMLGLVVVVVVLAVVLVTLVVAVVAVVITAWVVVDTVVAGPSWYSGSSSPLLQPKNAVIRITAITSAERYLLIIFLFKILQFLLHSIVGCHYGIVTDVTAQLIDRYL